LQKSNRLSSIFYNARGEYSINKTTRVFTLVLCHICRSQQKINQIIGYGYDRRRLYPAMQKIAKDSVRCCPVFIGSDVM
jgi:hypothetical protein